MHVNNQISTIYWRC